MKILYRDDVYRTRQLPSSLFFRAHSGRIRYLHKLSTRTTLHLSMFSSSQMETVELSKLDLAFISCEPARFLTESTSHFSKVLLTRLMWGHFSWSRGGILLLLGGLGSGFLQEQECWVPAERRLRSRREMATSSGDSAPLMLPVETPASLQDWLCELPPTSLPGVPASSASSVLPASFTLSATVR